VHPVPAALAELVMRCLAKKPQDRPRGVAEVMVALEQLALSTPWSQVEAERWWKNHEMAPDTDKQQEST
jgi:hypothetical protein